jgi:nucleotide-binding universal stress UspA family protein
MTVCVWIAEGGWQAAVDAARGHAGEDDVVLLHVSEDDVPEVAHGAFSGLLGRGHRERDPGPHIEDLATTSGAELLAAAAERLGRPARLEERHGRVEREVVAAAEGAALLVVARDGDPTRLGPHSLRKHARFIVDHAPCPVLLVWPGEVPSVAAIPPPPPHPPHRR